MKNRNLISLAVVFGFLSIGLTGILMYFGQRGGVTTVHVIFGLLFTAVALFHMINNWNSIKLYTRDKQKRSIRKEFILVNVVLLAVLIGAAVNLKPFTALAHAGEELSRGENERGRDFFRNVSFEEIFTNKEVNSTSLSFIIQKSNISAAPLIAIWVVDSTGRFVENLFVPAKMNILPPDVEDVRRAIFENKVEKADLKPELLSEWSASSGDKKPNYEGATPVENFFLNTKTSAGDRFSVLLEINNNGTKEIYTTDVDLSAGKIFRLVAKDHKLLTRAILEVTN
jgi:hypothetical protein